MLFRRKRQAWLSLVFPLVIVGARHCFASFFIGVGKVILALAIASLLMFLVVRSSFPLPDIPSGAKARLAVVRDGADQSAPFQSMTRPF